MRKDALLFRALLCLVLVFMLQMAVSPVSAQDYKRVNLVSDISGVALRADANLVNAWGMAFSDTSPVWIANNGTGTSTLYLGDGTPFPSPAAPLVVQIPRISADTPATPTGLVFNSTPGFVVTANGKSGASVFIFATEDGTINGWSPGVDLHNAILVVNKSASGAVYKGLATGTNGGQPFLYATNFHDGVVEMYDATFTMTKTFTDPNVPAGFAPFGIQNIKGDLYVTFALQNEEKHDDVAGAGNGFIDVFGTDGTWKSRFASQGVLNSPWGLALAPDSFGFFGGKLLVGNFGDGRINAFDFPGGTAAGGLKDTLGLPLTINGLWALKFGTGGPSGPRDHLLFTAGIGAEGHGLFGVVRPSGDDQQGNQH
jgi:uncharacterized protein (TIGR03118 family)